MDGPDTRGNVPGPSSWRLNILFAVSYDCSSGHDENQRYDSFDEHVVTSIVISII